VAFENEMKSSKKEKKRRKEKQIPARPALIYCYSWGPLGICVLLNSCASPIRPSARVHPSAARAERSSFFENSPTDPLVFLFLLIFFFFYEGKYKNRRSGAKE
jgi:hypothetical protein